VQAIDRDGRSAEAVQEAETLLAGSRLSDRWAARLRAANAIGLLRVGRTADSETAAEAALADGERTGDRFTMGYALHALAFVRMHDRDHAGASTAAGRRWTCSARIWRRRISVCC